MKRRPTKARHFPVISLTESEREYYNDVGAAIFKRAVAEYSRCNGSIDARHWGYVRTRKHISMYRSLEVRDDPRRTTMIGSGFIPGTLEDAIDGIYSDTTEDLRRVKTLLGYKFVDGAVLNVTGRREPSDPFRFEGIKWFAAKAPWGMTSTRDLLTYEQMGSIVDKTGAEVVFHVVQSINRTEWPANTVKGMTREETATCYLYRQDLHDLVRCFLWGEVYDLNPLSQRVAEYVIAGIWLNMTRSVKCAQAKRLSMLIATSKKPPSVAGNECSVCSRHVGIFVASHVECAGCREVRMRHRQLVPRLAFVVSPLSRALFSLWLLVRRHQVVCKSCSIDRPIFSVNARSKKPERRRFCKPCLCGAYVYPLSFSHTGVKRDRWDSASLEQSITTKSPVRERWQSAPEVPIFDASPRHGRRWGSVPSASTSTNDDFPERGRWESAPEVACAPPSMRGKMSLSDLMQIRMSISELLPSKRGGKPAYHARAGVNTYGQPVANVNVAKHKQGSTLSGLNGSDSSGSESLTEAADARRRAGFDKLKDVPYARQDEELSEFDLSALLEADISTRGPNKIRNNRKVVSSKHEDFTETLSTDELSEFDLNLLLEADISTRGERSTRLHTRYTRHMAGFDKLAAAGNASNGSAERRCEWADRAGGRRYDGQRPPLQWRQPRASRACVRVRSAAVRLGSDNVPGHSERAAVAHIAPESPVLPALA
ncbi:hypothetical protein PybrP1_000709 [[Pythium] brassicae (nom. inval.)]|nr:hypothetical protein PybrP1_000709 [[Pythium] brassicae (nom. inval.)]